ncbi:MAG: CopG family transcriptional regulator [SAR324 cluster bacterium]|nr:CopG family transcriptional regulator [SAR324 cluster bacterium]
MNSKIKYVDEPMEFEVVEDFLPPPVDLVFKEETIKVTINLNKSSVKFFKKKAQEVGIPYQKMIRKIVDLYANRYSDTGSSH